MNIRTVLSATTLAIATLTASSAFAQAASAPAPNVDARQERQHDRIKEGKASGELTKKESMRLHGEQRAIKRAQKRANADGTVTAKEQKRLDRMQNGASKDIGKQKHDEQAPVAK